MRDYAGTPLSEEQFWITVLWIYCAGAPAFLDWCVRTHWRRIDEQARRIATDLECLQESGHLERLESVLGAQEGPVAREALRRIAWQMGEGDTRVLGALNSVQRLIPEYLDKRLDRALTVPALLAGSLALPLACIGGFLIFGAILAGALSCAVVGVDLNSRRAATRGALFESFRRIERPRRATSSASPSRPPRGPWARRR